MKTTKKRSEDIGNLYGIPLDDILSQEQIEKIRKEKLNDARKNSKRRREKREESKRQQRKREFKIPYFTLTQSARYTLIASAAVLLILIIFKNSLSARIVPKTYVSNAFETTLSKVQKEVDDRIEYIFGFNPFDEKELTLTAKNDIKTDTLGNMEGLSVAIQTAYSDKAKNLSSVWNGVYNGQQFVTGSAYLNNDEVGFSMPELFGEYWVAPTKTFGREWNESGLRKALYAGALGEDANISFSNIFGEKKFLSDSGAKELKKLIHNFISRADAGYTGKKIISVNEKEKKGRSFRFTFEPDDMKDYSISLLNIFKNDSVFVQYISSLGVYDDTMADIDDLCGRLERTMAINSAEIEFVEYDGMIMEIGADISYTENNMPTILQFVFLSTNRDNITDGMRLSVISGGGKNYECTLFANGNQNGKKFGNTSSLIIISERVNLSVESDVNLDYKENLVEGTLILRNGNNIRNASYSGTCRKKKGFGIDLKEVAVEISGDISRNIVGDFSFALDKGMKISKINPANKKNILELNKADAEKYIKKLEETDNVKNYLALTEEIFGIIEK